MVEFPDVETSGGYLLVEAGFDPFDDVLSLTLLRDGREIWVIFDSPREVVYSDQDSEIYIVTDSASHRLRLKTLGAPQSSRQSRAANG